MKTLSRSFVYRLALALGLLALAAPTAPAAADEGQATPETGSYGYFRVVEGAASVAPAGATERSDAEVNQPVVAGDHLWVPSHSRVEIELADRNILRVDGGSELVLERLAASPDRDDRGTVVRLLEGNLQLVVTQDSLGDELPRVEVPSGTISPQTYGVYRVTADHDGWSQVVVRRGTAELAAAGGSSTVRAGEEAAIDNRAPADRIAEVREAGGFDGLERWARQLDDDYERADLRYVDDNLRYAAAPLARYGEWIDHEGSAYWRPRVAAGWRPYWQGRWTYLPSGLTWVSSEPWGWVPYHYGTWEYLPDYGWVWQPGAVWAPAWVYWYWGPSYVGWCPTGYYTHFYAGQFGLDFGFRSGLYGWAGGDWEFDRWSFVPTTYFSDGYREGYRHGYRDGRRDVRRYAVPADRFRNGRPLERGLITTDTKPLRPDTWKNPQAVLSALRNGHGGELPDVTPFIARKPGPSLPDAVAHAVRAENPRVLDGTPLRPGTLGHRPPRAGNGPSAPSVQGAEPGRNGRPPAVLPGRPDRGAPNPRAGGGDPAYRGDHGGRPVVRERPPIVRPPSADGGAPRPDRRPPVYEGRPERIDRRPPAEAPRSPAPPVVRERPAPERQPPPPRVQERPREPEKTKEQEHRRPPK
jgi:hypothetical protein